MTSSQNILLVTLDYPPPPGGIQTLVRNLELGLDKLGHNVYVLEINPKTCSYNVADLIPRRRSIPSFMAKTPHLFPFFNVVYRETKSAIIDYSPDIVHALHVREFPAVCAARDFDIPTVISTYALELSEKPLAGVALSNADLIHTISDYTDCLIKTHFGYEANRVIHPSIDLNLYQMEDRKGRTSDFVLCISRFVERKNIGTLIDAWEELDGDVRGKRKLFIAGNGPLYSTIQGRTADINDIELLGWITKEDKAKKLRNAELFVLPASGSGFDVEGFGIVYIEAQAAGTPVIGSSVGGVPEAVGEGGLTLRDECDHIELSNKIDSMLTNNALYDQCSRAAALRINQFGLETVAEEYVNLYQMGDSVSSN